VNVDRKTLTSTDAEHVWNAAEAAAAAAAAAEFLKNLNFIFY